jgi:hypothetical protein
VKPSSIAVAAGGTPKRPSPPRIHPVTGAKLYALQPGLEVAPDRQEIYVEAKVGLDTGILEFLLVQGETKAYESALTTAASPSQLMAGMILLKWRPGDLLDIMALHGGDTLSMDTLLRARDPESPRKVFRWRLLGSNHAEMEKTGSGFWADREGVHIALVERPEAVVQLEGDVKNPYHNAAFGFEIPPGTLGGKGRQVTLVFRKTRPQGR